MTPAAGETRGKTKSVSFLAATSILEAGETRGRMKVALLVGMTTTRVATEGGCGAQIVAHADEDTVMAVVGPMPIMNDWGEKPWPATVNHRLVSMLGERTFGAAGKTISLRASSGPSMWHRWS